MDLSIIIVSYNTCELTLNALRSVVDSQITYSYEVIVVDNNSTDDSVSRISQEFPQVTLIANIENLGFSKANNQAMKRAAGRYILLLNSDTVVNSDTLEIMVNFMDLHPEIGAGGCKVLLPDGGLDKACRRGFPTPSASLYYLLGLSKMFPNSPKFNQYQLGHLDPDQDYPVDCLVGAFMIVRRETIEQVGLLDEEFFMYGEDVDWCYRIKQHGWQLYYYPYTSIIHYKGASSRRRPFKIVYEFHRAMYLFHKKHYQQRYSFITNFIVYLGIALKFAITLLRNQLSRIG
ncbi:glycosyltransferase family 2 protein [Brevibacillus migulae]|uniref:glycosyltransferase family 2 protein n=1 Tax=Brevibacillus migulae TaxID=1644114 RepID=UPI00106DE8E4|nr:glycosyltransferase family 2 protein [Brevibacillus migulae]